MFPIQMPQRPLPMRMTLNMGTLVKKKPESKDFLENSDQTF
jgi:hypothetical protein